MSLITPYLFKQIGAKAAGLYGIYNRVTVPQFMVYNPDYNHQSHNHSISNVTKYLDTGVKSNFNPVVKYFSVRSSSPMEDQPNSAMAGRFESHINVKREDIPQTVERVRESMREIHTKYGYSDLHRPVIIQAMVWGQPGIVFTKLNPLNKYTEQELKDYPHLAHMTFEFYPKITKSTTVDQMGVSGTIAPTHTSYSDTKFVHEYLPSDLECLEVFFNKDFEVIHTRNTTQQWSGQPGFQVLQCRNITA